MALQRLEAGECFSADEIASILGRCQWATAICPTMEAFLQPFWAWKQACATSGRPSRLLRTLAACLRMLIHSKSRRPSPFAGTSPWHGSADAGASDTGCYVAGWFTNKPNATKSEVYWFLWDINETQHPWAFKKDKAQKLIAALEMFALFGNGALHAQNDQPWRISWSSPAILHGQPGQRVLLVKK